MSSINSFPSGNFSKMHSSKASLIAILLTHFLVASGKDLNPYKDYRELARQVEDLIHSARNFTYPASNEEFYIPGKEQSCVNGEFDFIIVGTGTAGGVLANRLTEIEGFTVLALEAGDETPLLSSMLGVNIYLHHTKYNWGYKTVPQENMCLGSRENQCPYPRGKMLGGSSSINYGMYVRGHHEDFDYWEQLGNPGWSYEDVLPYFKKPEHATFSKPIDYKYHGFDGPQKIGIPNDTPLLTQALLDCHKDLGKEEKDYNGEDQDGVSRLQFFLDGNTRSSSNHAFIEPARGRPNLVVSTNSYVTKILIEKKTAKGVKYIKGGHHCIAMAKREVILSAGSINSPQILMLSGIGPREELTKHEIKVIKNLPVGKYMQDHQFFPGIFYRTDKNFYNTTLLENVKLWTQNLRPLTASLGQQTISFWNFMGPSNSPPEIEFFFFGPPMLSSDLAFILGYRDEYVEIFKTLNPHTDFSVNIELLHPRSEGSVKLRSSNPLDFPLIDPNYFSDPDDIDMENMYKGVQVALKFNETQTFRNLKAELLILPYPECDATYKTLSKDWWYCAIKTLSSTLYHPIATTRMGPDPKSSVVDADLKVHGINRLRVVDAGVMPDHISGHPNAGVVMIAEKISDEIKAEHLLTDVYFDY